VLPRSADGEPRLDETERCGRRFARDGGSASTVPARPRSSSRPPASTPAVIFPRRKHARAADSPVPHQQGPAAIRFRRQLQRPRPAGSKDLASSNPVGSSARKAVCPATSRSPCTRLRARRPSWWRPPNRQCHHADADVPGRRHGLYGPNIGFGLTPAQALAPTAPVSSRRLRPGDSSHGLRATLASTRRPPRSGWSIDAARRSAGTVRLTGNVGRTAPPLGRCVAACRVGKERARQRRCRYTSAG
jgi:hypothetical protein